MAKLPRPSTPSDLSRAVLGGIPTKAIDIPFCGVLVTCYLRLGPTYMTIFRRDRAQGRSFKLSVPCFAFCMARVVTFVMRIAWAAELTKPNVAIVSNVLVATGVILPVHVICMK
jgi:hypothetical protein